MKKAPLLSVLFALTIATSAMTANSHTSSFTTEHQQSLIEDRKIDGVSIQPPLPIKVMLSDDENAFKDQLPKTVKVYKGTVASDVPVSWNTPSFDTIKQSTMLTVTGTVNVDGKDYTTNLEITILKVVKGFVGAIELNYAPDIDLSTKLPKDAGVILSDGSYEHDKVTWKEIPSITGAGEYTAKGSLSSGIEVECPIKVYSDDSPKIGNISKEISTIENNYADKVNLDKLTNGSKDLADKTGANWSEQCKGTNKPADGIYTYTITFKQQQKDLNRINISFAKENNASDTPNIVSLKYFDTTNTEQSIDVADLTINQDKTNFNLNAELKNPIKQTSKIIIGLKNTEGTPIDAPAQDTSYWHALTELEIYGVAQLSNDGAATPSSNAKVSNILINDTGIKDFAPNTNYNYNYEKKWDEDELKIDVKTIDSNAYSHVLRIKYEGFEKYIINVVSQDLSNNTRYEITVTTARAPIEKVELVNLPSSLTLFNKVSLETKITDKLGGLLSTKDGVSVEYQVIDETGKATIINNNELVATSAGYISLVAKATFKGETICSEQYTLKIEKQTTTAQISELKTVNVTINQGDKISLPETVEAYYNINNTIVSLPTSVNWQQIPDEYLSKPGSFTIQGTVDGTALKAICNITIISQGELKSDITIQGSRAMVPSFPARVDQLMDTNGNIIGSGSLTMESASLVPSKYDVDVGTIVQATGYINNDSKKQVTVNVEIVEGSISEDYSRDNTGFADRQGFASDAAEGSDKTFVDGSGAKYISPSEAKTQYVGYLFNEKKSINYIEIPFADDTHPTDIKLKVLNINSISEQARQEVVANPLKISTTNASLITTESNWKEITLNTRTLSWDGNNLKLNIPTEYTLGYKVDFNVAQDKPVTITDLIAKGRTNLISQDVPTLTELNYQIGSGDKINLLGKRSEAKEFTIDWDGKSDVDITYKMEQNSAGYVSILPNLGDNTIRVRLSDINKNNSFDYLIRLNDTRNIYKNITSVETLGTLEVKSASTIEGLNLPSKVKITLDNGKTEEVGVQFDTSSFIGKKGVYNFKGTLDLPLEYKNALNLEVYQTVIVQEDSSFSFVNSYKVTVNGVSDFTILNNTNSKEAAEGQTIFVKVNNFNNEVIDKVTGLDNVNIVSADVFSFTMPSNDVTLEVSTKKVSNSNNLLTPVIVLSVFFGITLLAFVGYLLYDLVFKKKQKKA